MADNTSAVAQEEMQLVIFDLAGEAYGVDIGVVDGIIRMQAITEVPGTLDFVEGVINLRGEVIPVVDTRKRFGLAVTEETKDSRIVVVDIGGHKVGMVVDAVTEVLHIAAESVEPPSSVITTSDSTYLMGIAKLEGRLIILLDLEQIFSGVEKESLSSEAIKTSMEKELPIAETATASASVSTSEAEAVSATPKKSKNRASVASSKKA
jgi:purine-binding chemotaxis protein CheW